MCENPASNKKGINDIILGFEMNKNFYKKA